MIGGPEYDPVAQIAKRRSAFPGNRLEARIVVMAVGVIRPNRWR
jgi:hypothetical protein